MLVTLSHLSRNGSFTTCLPITIYFSLGESGHTGSPFLLNYTSTMCTGIISVTTTK